MAYDVFLSYSSKDTQAAETVCSVLEADGLRCWIAPRDITPGVHWGEAIIEGITACKAMVVVFSSNANKSQQVLREVERAVAKGLAILPFRIEPILPSKAMEYFLSVPHWLNALSPPLEKHAAQLALVVRRTLASTPEEEEIRPFIPDVEVSEVVESNSTLVLSQTTVETIKAPVAPDPIELALTKVESAVQKGSLLSQEFEKAQSVSPLTRHFSDLSARIKGGVFAISLLGLESGLSEFALRWLWNDRETKRGISLPGQIGFAEVGFHQDHFSIHLEGGADWEGKDSNEFLTKIANLPLNSDQLNQVIGLTLRAPEALTGIRLNWVKDLETLSQTALGIGRLATESGILVIAGTSQSHPRGEDLENLTDLLSSVDAVLPLVIIGDGEVLPASGWWTNDALFEDTARLAAEPVTNTLQSEPMLFNPRGKAVRSSLQLHHYSRRLWHSAQMLLETVSEKNRSLSRKQSLLKRQLHVLQNEEKRGSKVLSLPQATQEQLKAQVELLLKSIREANERALKPDAPLLHRLKLAVQQVGTEGLVLSPEGNYVAGPQALKKLSEVVTEGAKDRRGESLKTLADGFNQLQRSILGQNPGTDVDEFLKMLKAPSAKEEVDLFDPTKPFNSSWKSLVTTSSPASKGSRLLAQGMQLLRRLPEKVAPVEVLEAAKVALLWEIQISARAAIDQDFESIEEYCRAFFEMRSGAGQNPAGEQKAQDERQARLSSIKAELHKIDSSLSDLKLQETGTRDLQQECADVESETRRLMLKVIHPAPEHA